MKGVCVVPLDFFTSGSGSASLINCPSSFTFPKVIFLERQREKVASRERQRERE